jgi:dTDP-4-amino-4,6-dideoxygalactose transaminase
MKFDVSIPFSVPDINDDDRKEVAKAFESRWLTGGPKAKTFEDLFASYMGVNHAVSVNSCTAALHLSLKSLGIKPNDEVVVPVITFAATANAALFCGAKPVFVDIDEKTFNLSVEDLQKKITKRTKVVIPVHYGGQSCDMKAIMEIAEDRHLSVVEDCAHSAGSTYKGQKTGSFGIGCFSFYPTKNMTTIEGGMITTNDEAIAKRCSLDRSHGMTKDAFDREKLSWYYDVVELGYNYRLNELQAALGISQLSRLDQMNERKRKNAKYFTSKLEKVSGLVTPFEVQDCYHAYHLYVVKVIEKEFGISRNELYLRLSKKGIGLSVHYTPLHLLSFYKQKLGYQRGDFPIAEKVYEQILSLPMYPQLTEQQMDFVVEQIIEASKTK